MHIRHYYRPIHRRSRSLGPDVFERLWVDAHRIPRYRDPYRLGPHLYDSDVVVVKTRANKPVSSYDDLSIGRASGHAQRVRDFTVDDHDSIRSASRRQDAALLSDISSRLNRLEFESVKPGLDVALKTGFRRPLYHKKLPTVKKAARKNRVAYPWDYTKYNLFRSNNTKWIQKKKSKREQLAEQVEEKKAGSIYPEHDPLGLYRPRPKREKKEALPEASKAAERFESMNALEVLAYARAKAYAKPLARDPCEDIEVLLRPLSRPLPQSQVKDFIPYTGGIDDVKPLFAVEAGEMDPTISRKISESKHELADFERMLEDRFRRRSVVAKRPTVVAAEQRSLVDWDALAEEFGLDEDFYSRPHEVIHPSRLGSSLYHHHRAYPHSEPVSPLLWRASSLPPPSSRSHYYSEDLSFPEYRPRISDFYSRPHEVIHPSRLGSSLYHHHRAYPHSEPLSPLWWSASSLPPPSSRSHYYSEDLSFPEYRPRISSFVRAGSVPPVGTAASSELAIRNARRAASRIEHELGSGYHDDDYVPPPRRAYSLGRHEMAYIDDDVYVPRRHHGRAIVTTTSPAIVRRHTRTLAGRPPLPVTSRHHELEDLTTHYATPVVPPLSITSLRSKAADARSKMDHTKLLLDRYLPIHMGPEPAVEYEVQAKYGELEDSELAPEPHLTQERLRKARRSAKSLVPRSATLVSTHAKSYARPRVIRTILHTEPLIYTFLPAKLGGFFDKQPYVGYKAWKPYKSSYVPYRSVYKPPKIKSSGYVRAQYDPLPGYKGNYKSSLYTPYISVRSKPGCYRSCYVPLETATRHHESRIPEKFHVYRY